MAIVDLVATHGDDYPKAAEFLDRLERIEDADGFHPIHSWKLDVHQDQIRFQLFCHDNCFQAVCGFATHFQIGLRVDNTRQTFA